MGVIAIPPTEVIVISATCLDYINQNQGTITQNEDGSISVFILNNLNGPTPFIINKACCKAINPNYVFDLETQKCMWSVVTGCTLSDSFKLILNPKGNDGSIFNIESGENCSLDISFNYLFNIKCETLVNILNNTTPLTPAQVETLALINSLQLQISAQTVICQGIANQIAQKIVSINNTPYSITQCPPPPPQPVQSINSVNLTNFNNSAFSIPPFSFAAAPQNNVPVTPPSYCLSTQGLAQWAIILGPVN